MALIQSPSVITNGLVFYYDIANTQKSSRGAPTTNISSSIGIGTYLNTPSDVTSTLTQTSELYQGQPVYKQVLTPITATGVSYLTNAGNPGIGVVTGGGGGAAARYTGHSIFFKPAVGRLGLNSSTPIYTHYSNIGGWQSSGNYDDMGDGWYRAHVIFYSAGGGSDGKYWAINPAGATLNVPLTVYWAGPFKEDRNDSTHVSPYVNDTRSNTQSILDLTGNNTVTANSLTYASDGTFSFNGSSNNLSIGSFSGYSTNITCEAWFKTTSAATWKNIVCGPTNDLIFTINGSLVNFGCQGSTPIPHANYSTTTVNTGAWFHAAATYNGSFVNIYVNGNLESTNARTGNITSGAKNIGSNSGGSSEYFNGTIGNVKIYNRALSAAEVQQNFNAIRARYGI